MPKLRKATYRVHDVQRGAKPSLDRDIQLGVTQDPVEALKMVQGAMVLGTIDMALDDGQMLSFTPHLYSKHIKADPGHRRDRKGNDMFHGFMSYCTRKGYGDPCPPIRSKKKAVTKKRKRKMVSA